MQNLHHVYRALVYKIIIYAENNQCNLRGKAWFTVILSTSNFNTDDFGLKSQYVADKIAVSEWKIIAYIAIIITETPKAFDIVNDKFLSFVLVYFIKIADN